MYQWARPRIAVPVHGEPRHIREHVKLAEALQVPETIAPGVRGSALCASLVAPPAAVVSVRLSIGKRVWLSPPVPTVSGSSMRFSHEWMMPSPGRSAMPPRVEMNCGSS